MIKVFKHTIVYTFAAIVLIASGGFTFYHHACSTNNYQKSAFLLEDADCNHENDQICSTSEIEMVATSCCESSCDANRNSCDPLQTEDDCCSTEVNFFKTDDFNFEGFEKKSFKFISGYVVVFLNDLKEQKLEGDHAQLNFFDLPPPKFGKDLLIHLNQIKIDSPLI